MSGGLDVLQLKEDDVMKLLAAQAHLGANNCNFQMEQYVYKRTASSAHIIDLRKTWEKLLLAARAIAAIEYPADVCVISARPQGQRAVLKFASYTGTTPIAGRFTPGAFTNHARQAAFREPRLLVVSDPRLDHQPIREASYVNVPVIALANTDSPLRYVDIAIPCNTKSSHALGLLWWMLAREVLRLRGSISRDVEWDVMPDLFFFREEADKEQQEQIAAGATKDTTTTGGDYSATTGADTGLGAADFGPGIAALGATSEWGADPGIGSTAFGDPKPAAAADDWTINPTTTNDWAATPATGGGDEWGGPSTEAWDAH